MDKSSTGAPNWLTIKGKYVILPTVLLKHQYTQRTGDRAGPMGREMRTMRIKQFTAVLLVVGLLLVLGLSVFADIATMGGGGGPFPPQAKIMLYWRSPMGVVELPSGDGMYYAADGQDIKAVPIVTGVQQQLEWVSWSSPAIDGRARLVPSGREDDVWFAEGNGRVLLNYTGFDRALLCDPYAVAKFVDIAPRPIIVIGLDVQKLSSGLWEVSVSFSNWSARNPLRLPRLRVECNSATSVAVASMNATGDAAGVNATHAGLQFSAVPGTTTLWKPCGRTYAIQPLPDGIMDYERYLTLPITVRGDSKHPEVWFVKFKAATLGIASVKPQPPKIR